MPACIIKLPRNQARCIELGSLDQQLVWASDLDGKLGQGSILSTNELSVGKHLITVTAEDGAGAESKAEIELTIVANLADLPAAADRLIADPGDVVIDNTSTVSATLVIHNQNIDNVLTWNASSNQPWLTLSNVTGATPAMLTLSLGNNAPQTTGHYTATINISSPTLAGQSEEVLVSILISNTTRSVYLPVVLR